MSNPFRNLNHLIHLFFNPSAKIAVRKSGSTKAYPIQLPKKKNVFKNLTTHLPLTDSPTHRHESVYPVTEKNSTKNSTKKETSKTIVFQKFKLTHLSNTKMASKYRNSSYQILPEKERKCVQKCDFIHLRIDRKYHATLKSISTSSRKRITGKFVAKKKEKKKRKRIQMEYSARRKV